MGDFNERNYNDGYGQNRGNRDNFEKRDEIIFSRKVRAGKPSRE